MYNNPYMQNYNPNINQQSFNERIDNQIAQLQQMKEQMKNNQPTAINQTFQLAPANKDVIRYAGSIDEVQRDMVIGDTPFFSKDMSIVWIKNTKGEIKTYELTEIIAKDDKDIQIELLQAQINEMKGMIENAKSNDVNVNESTENEKSTNVPISKSSTKKSK